MGSIRLGEIKLEAEHYSFTGGVVSDQFWTGLERRFAIDPARFAENHPNLVGFLTPPKCLGELPNGPLLDGLRKRYDIDPERFASHHPFWAPLLAREVAAETTCLMSPPIVLPPITPPPVIFPPVITPPITLPPTIAPGVVPEPASCGMLAFCIAAVWIAMILRTRRRSRDT